MGRALRGISELQWSKATKEAREHFTPLELAFLRGYITGLSRTTLKQPKGTLPLNELNRVFPTEKLFDWQIRNLSQGKCIRCEFKRYFPSKLCRFHLHQTRRYYRKASGNKSWETTHRGKVPLEVERKRLGKARIKEELATETAFWKEKWEAIEARRDKKKVWRKDKALIKKQARGKVKRPRRHIPKVEGISRQAIWQRLQLAEGKCRLCNGPRFGDAQFCHEHLLKIRKKNRERAEAIRRKLGCRKYRKSIRGGRPLTETRLNLSGQLELPLAVKNKEG